MNASAGSDNHDSGFAYFSTSWRRGRTTKLSRFIAATAHLPEFCLRAHELEEDQVPDLRDVNPSIEHVHRDRDVRRPLLAREVIDQVLHVLGLERDDARELAPIVRVVGVEALRDEV